MNRYCGPYVIAHLLGESPDDAARRVREYRNLTGRYCKAVKGMHVLELKRVLHRAGLRVGEVGSYRQESGRYLTLAAWLKRYRKERSEKMFVVTITGHFILVKGRKIYDNNNPNGVFLRKFRHRRARVRRFFFVERVY
jgi:hypothetical protein